MLFLDALYRDGAGKAGITYVDVWDGFVDDAGRFAIAGVAPGEYTLNAEERAPAPAPREPVTGTSVSTPSCRSR